MNNHEWDTLAAQWDSQEVGDPALLQKRLRRHVRWNRLGLFGEAFGMVFVLGLMASTWTRNVEMRSWLIVASVLLVLGQGIYLLLRHRYRLFGAPDGGLIGLIDAEIRRARFVIATHWVGLVVGLLMFSLAWVVLPVEHHPRLVLSGWVCALLVVPYMAVRSGQMARRIRSLRGERQGLEG